MTGPALVIKRPGHSHNTGRRVNRKAPARIVDEAVSDRIVRRIRVGGERSDPDHRTDDGIFGDGIGGVVRISGRSDVEQVSRGDGDLGLVGGYACGGPVHAQDKRGRPSCGGNIQITIAVYVASGS